MIVGTIFPRIVGAFGTAIPLTQETRIFGVAGLQS